MSLVRSRRPWAARLGYASAGGAGPLLWSVTAAYLPVYYTDVAALPAASVGVLFLAARLVDAALDPWCGVVVDRTRSRWGRFRPYFLWSSLPLASLAVLAFSVPGWSEPGRLMWAFVTYLLLSAAYSFVAIPVVAILPALTTDGAERVRMSSWRTAGDLVTSVAAGAAMLPLVALLGGDDPARGYTWTAGVFAACATLLLLGAFASLRENAVAGPPLDRRRLWTVLRFARSSRPLWVLAVGSLLLNAASVTRIGSIVYFCRDYLGDQRLVPLLHLSATLMVVGLLVAGALCRRVGKRDALVAALVVQMVGFALPIPFGTSVAPVLLGTAVASVALGTMISVQFAVLADIIDFTHWRTGVRADGVIAALALLSAKVGTALGGGALGWMLAAGGYQPGVPEQTAAALASIRWCFYGLPLIAWLTVVILLLAFYRVDEMLPRIRSDLAARAATSSSTTLEDAVE